MATNTKQLPEVLFYLHYAPKGVADAQAGANVNFIAKLKPTWFTPKIVVCCRSFYEFPDAADDPNVLGTLEVCRQRGFSVVAGRDCWVRDGTRAQELAEWSLRWAHGVKAWITAEYMTSTVAELYAFARAIGADGTFLDLEPNGKESPFAYLNKPLSQQEWRDAHAAMWLLREKVDYARPFGHRELWHAYHFAGLLADTPIHWTSDAIEHPWIPRSCGLQTWQPVDKDGKVKQPQSLAQRMLEQPGRLGLFAYIPWEHFGKALAVIHD